MSFLIRDLCDEYFETFMSFKQFEKWLILLYKYSILRPRVQKSLDFDMSFFSYSKLLVLLTEPGVLTCQVSSIIHYLLFLLSTLNSVIGFSKLNTTRKIPLRYYFTQDAHPFIRPGIPALFIFPSARIWHH